ncbi:cytochrome P450 [Vararia minispora EC-137]|uniref:Cytochrome P450 n=1 Tax=Vararia minispora EC-137 TaxID=1314806 RepID=A0ACB8Q633_9AGAM|nr:cytochrome P450 [Vararia minispora EC-137]
MLSSGLWYLADGAALLTFAVLGWQYLSSKRSALPLPPGPKPLPIVGNIFDVPKSFAWVHYQRWTAKYGDVISLTVLGKVIVVLNSVAAIQDLVLTARANVFASRPHIKAVEMTNMHDQTVFLAPYGRKWRDRRRIIDKYFRPAAIQAYQPVLQDRVTLAMKRLAQDPARFRKHIRECTNAVVLSTVYGYDVKDGGDLFVGLAEEVAALVKYAVLPGSTIVNTLPFLGSLPTWALGPAFHRLIQRGKYVSYESIHAPFRWTKDSIRNGTARQSLARESLEELAEGDEEGELVLREAFGAIFGAASDTTVAAISAFILAMTLFPDVQARAHGELDTVVGRDRLPAFSDRPNLPYIDALVHELLRWSPVVPQGVPHVADEDVVWKGYRIPKGAMVIGNAWAILHDPASYAQPEIFRPERFLSPDGRFVADPSVDYYFGFGVRRCPGRHLLDTVLWLFIVTVLAEFKIAGGEASPDISAEDIPFAFMGEGVTTHPLPFECSILPRDARALQVIEAA